MARAGALLFERTLPDGSTLRVSAEADPNWIVVEWPGSPEPVDLPLTAGDWSSTGTADEWRVFALHPCPGDEATQVRAFQTANPGVSDEMALVDGLAVVVVPPSVPPSHVPLPDTSSVTVETRDVDGNVLSSVVSNADVVASEDENRSDELADATSPSRQPAGPTEGSAGGVPGCEDRP